MSRTGHNRPLMREILDKLDKCERRMSKLLNDSATNESETNFPIKMTHQESNKELVYLSRTRKGTMRSKMVTDKINDMKRNLDRRVSLRKTGKAKVDSKPPTITANSAKRKRDEDAVDMRQGADRYPGTSNMMVDVATVPPILMTGLRSASYKIKRRDRTGATLEINLLSQCDESTLRVLTSSGMNHGKGSVTGQLTP